ncbi:MAG: hypothetical protein PHI55_00830 [Burkholderiaceae bacterium]|nr:hypothetical protein [Burkholderiaceae bacterium]
MPAIEATLLTLLGQHAPHLTAMCKNALQKHAPGDPTDARYDTRHFPLPALEQVRSKIPALKALVAAVRTE